MPISGTLLCSTTSAATSSLDQQWHSRDEDICLFFSADTHTSLLVALSRFSRRISCTFYHSVLNAAGISEVIRVGTSVCRSATRWPKVIQLLPIIPSIPFKEKYVLYIPRMVGSYIVADIHLLNIPNLFFYLSKDFLQEPITVSLHHSVWLCTCVSKSFTEPREPSAVYALFAEFFNVFNEHSVGKWIKINWISSSSHRCKEEVLN